jgi:hypothetical protein
VLLTAGCASSPAAPFNTMKDSQLQAFRLQNYEAPAAATPAPGQPGAVIPGLPPEIQQWVQQGADGLRQLLPPGLLPPNLGVPVPPPEQQVERFNEFRVLEKTQVLDPELREQLGELLGDEDSFQGQSSCQQLYAELGLRFFAPGAAAPYDVLISFSCRRVASRNFSWPHPASGLTTAAVKDLADIVEQIFPVGPAMAPPPAAWSPTKPLFASVRVDATNAL